MLPAAKVQHFSSNFCKCLASFALETDAQRHKPLCRTALPTLFNLNVVAVNGAENRHATEGVLLGELAVAVPLRLVVGDLRRPSDSDARRDDVVVARDSFGLVDSEGKHSAHCGNRIHRLLWKCNTFFQLSQVPGPHKLRNNRAKAQMPRYKALVMIIIIITERLASFD